MSGAGQTRAKCLRAVRPLPPDADTLAVQFCLALKTWPNSARGFRERDFCKQLLVIVRRRVYPLRDRPHFHGLGGERREDLVRIGLKPEPRVSTHKQPP